MASKNESEDPDTMSDSDAKSNAKLEAKQHNSGARDLEKVTDYVEEAEIKSNAALSDAMKNIGEDKQRADEEAQKVKINKDDVDLIAREMDIPRQVAERKLRAHIGDVFATLIELTT